MAREVGKKVDILLSPGTEQSWAYNAYMEASMAPHDLTERASELRKKLLQDLEFRKQFTRRNVDPETKEEWDRQWDEMIALHDKQTRRAALLEARQAVLGERLSATEIYSIDDEVYNDAIDDALGAIDRLAQEG